MLAFLMVCTPLHLKVRIFSGDSLYIKYDCKSFFIIMGGISVTVCSLLESGCTVSGYYFSKEWYSSMPEMAFIYM